MKISPGTLAVGLWLCLAATALPSDSAPQSRGPQGPPGPGPSAAPVAPSPDVAHPPSDEGLSAFTIMLISLGGALALTGVAYIVTRATQHRRALN